ncbi:hypothetical protein M0Q39_04770 [Patescibacteria group bacterium]|jgi:hypothetical protein|nr:hypothetical protein [Patescibacteria group bacterium]
MFKCCLYCKFFESLKEIYCGFVIGKCTNLQMIKKQIQIKSDNQNNLVYGHNTCQYFQKKKDIEGDSKML